MSSILVTGASGLIGGRIAARLSERGIDVIGIDARPPKMPDIPYSFITADINDTHRLHAATMRKPLEAIVHCGGISGLMVARDNPFLICETNIRGTAQVFELARIRAVRRVVFCSTLMVYGGNSDGVLTEASSLMPASMYAASKVAGEAILRAYAEEHGIDGVALRISHVYGPGRETECFIRQMIEDAIARRPTLLPHARRSRRQYVYVDDVVDAILLAIMAPHLPQRAYNIAAHEQLTIEEVAHVAKHVLGPIEVGFDDANDPPEYRMGKLDISAAMRDLGFAPRRSLEQGISLYAKWLRSANDAVKKGIVQTTG